MAACIMKYEKAAACRLAKYQWRILAWLSCANAMTARKLSQKAEEAMPSG